MQMSEGPRAAPPVGIKGGAGRAPDRRSRCLPGAGGAAPGRASRPVSPRVVYSPDNLPPLLVRTRGRVASKVRGGERAAEAARGDTRPPHPHRVCTYLRLPQRPGCALSQWERGRPAPTPDSPRLSRWHLPRSCALASLSPGNIQSGRKVQHLV